MPMTTRPTSLTSTGVPLCTATHDVADVLERLEAAQAAHVVELAALGVEAAAGVGVVGGQRSSPPAATDRPTAATLAGSSSTWYCIVPPPKPESSATPGTERYCGSMVQSSKVFSSIGERSELCST